MFHCIAVYKHSVNSTGFPASVWNLDALDLYPMSSSSCSFGTNPNARFTLINQNHPIQTQYFFFQRKCCIWEDK